ncbi:MAG TPA: hypothetical protein VIL86_10985 [Tepidisphaeraceae bacterium]|jgi:hypothetical protein
MADEIYVALLDEGVDVWRPVPAKKVGGSTYTILQPSDYDPDDEKWQFPPGSTVECAPRKTSAGVVLAAVKSVGPGRRIA